MQISNANNCYNANYIKSSSDYSKNHFSESIPENIENNIKESEPVLIKLFFENNKQTEGYLKICKSSSYSKENPIFKIVGKDNLGKEIDQTINVNNVNPKNASYLEMNALYCNLALSNSSNDMISSLSLCIPKPHEVKNQATIYDKLDYMTTLNNKMNMQLKFGNIDGYSKMSNAYKMYLKYC